MRWALLVVAAGISALPQGTAIAQTDERPSAEEFGAGYQPMSRGAFATRRAYRANSPAQETYGSPGDGELFQQSDGAAADNLSRQRYSTFDTSRRDGILPAALEQSAASEPPGMPLRRAYQAPDIFRTPNPTPLERVPSPQDPYSPRQMPGQNQYPSPPSAKPEPPLPPFAPLVNMRFTETWLPAGSNQLGMDDIDTRATLAAGRTGVFVTPGFGVHFLDGPTRTDLPGTLYDVYLDIRYKKQINETWGYEVAFTPSWYSDGDNNSSDAWRFITTALGFYQATPEWQIMAGVMYLDRFDINWFPIFGAIWADPDGNSDWRYEFVFPRPKFAYRVLRCDNRDQWAYVAGEFGGGAWAVQRTNGQDDMVAYRDWRAVVGYESKVNDYSAISWFTEVGVVFHRQVEFKNGAGDFNPDPAGMLRFGVWY